MGQPRGKALVLLAALTLLGPLGSCAAAAPPASTLTGSMDSLRALDVVATGSLAPGLAPSWRSQVDGDASGAVSAEELGVFERVIEQLVAHPEDGAFDAYNITWAAENASSAHKFTLEGRSNLSAFAFRLAPTYRFGASLDGVAGAFDRVAFSFEQLAGPVAVNATITLTVETSLTWGPQDATRDVHRLEVQGPPTMAFRFQVGGSLEIVGNASIASVAVDNGQSVLTGVTTGPPAVVLLRERPVSNAALAIVGAAIVGPALVVGIVALVVSRRMQVKESPLPVEPRYK